ncbi:MAG: phytanoyl-CoA dioxygenase family protein [Stappiaceae bacterium]
MNVTKTIQSGFYAEEACDLSEFASLTAQTVRASDVPGAVSAEKNVPVYDMDGLRSRLENGSNRSDLLAEWAGVLQKGAGVFVLRKAYSDTRALDEATDVYYAIIEEEKQASGGGADHFAAAGSNDRIWNSLQKLCERAPETFVDYFSNQAIDAACESWLGPNYQMTAQVNVVHPGGKAQQAHRDYHLGFQTAEVSATYPAHVHDLSPLMTLQGGIAHVDVPIESGPTKLLPFSQLYRPGYAAWRRDDFRTYFEEHCVQLPLKKGDALFFNPALFHAAGENISADIHRMVNLLQISSAFGRAMETIDREKMCLLTYPCATRAWQSGTLSEQELNALIACTGEGYSFPTNLDRDPPVGGLAPRTQQALFKEAIISAMSETEFKSQLRDQEDRRKS